MHNRLLSNYSLIFRVNSCIFMSYSQKFCLSYDLKFNIQNTIIYFLRLFGSYSPFVFLQVFSSFLLHFAPMRSRLLYLEVINIKMSPILLS